MIDLIVGVSPPGMIIFRRGERDKYICHIYRRGVEGLLLGWLQKSSPDQRSNTANHKCPAQARHGKCQAGSEREKPQAGCRRADQSLGPSRLLASPNPVRCLLSDRGSGFPDFFLEGDVLLSTQARPLHEPLDLLFPLLPF